MSSINLFVADEHTSTGFREATLDEIMNGARQALSARVRRGTVLNYPRLTANFLTARLAQRPYETFTLIYLDNRHRMIILHLAPGSRIDEYGDLQRFSLPCDVIC